MSKPSILVTGATGRHGGTGIRIVEILRSQGFFVKAMVRRKDERSLLLEKMGAEVVEADFHNYPSLAQALAGVKQAYFCYPVASGIVEATTNFAAVGRESGLEYVVNNSMGASHPVSPSPLARAQWMSEQILTWAGFDCVHLRGGFFFENILLFSEQSIITQGRIANSFGDNSITWLAAEDMAQVSAKLLSTKNTSFGSVVPITANERIPLAEVVRIFSSVLGKPIQFENLEFDEWRKHLRENPRINPEMIEHLIGLAKLIQRQNAMPLVNTVEQITGKQPILLAEFVQKHRERLLNKIAQVNSATFE
ncbi:NmrA family NAD(P)-binding protein [Nostoc sp. NMS8]|uniref:NmrA family NAD(P)-binding protein n=1 Tax=Nostoc sp. NMS8 TaxID=2815392 RepID=UPI0025F4946F|nr:NmrA family NAD(P)-binding protein [Nostoc sp. NMS8]MBN3961593.1 NmrA family NAD(P)-binding protein [Nostoc sp. NMS8]